ncbi:hypothetical protein AAFF_G00334470 [Aldrovandia affinis]|uniref:Uncharacterized protein n=1 Tax=Aldrovandia affinis TaxID=143900 RepID=A0AAD7SL21_9TELE|nr:hypothetical protein AAFF_G00334470 [Aldrovandia affinis]
MRYREGLSHASHRAGSRVSFVDGALETHCVRLQCERRIVSGDDTSLVCSSTLFAVRRKSIRCQRQVPAPSSASSAQTEELFFRRDDESGDRTHPKPKFPRASPVSGEMAMSRTSAIVRSQNQKPTSALIPRPFVSSADRRDPVLRGLPRRGVGGAVDVRRTGSGTGARGNTEPERAGTKPSFHTGSRRTESGRVELLKPTLRWSAFVTVHTLRHVAAITRGRTPAASSEHSLLTLLRG